MRVSLVVSVKEVYMTKFSTAVLFFVATGLAPAADRGLLRLVMPDAKVVAGIQVDQSKHSPFGQYVLSQMQSEDEGFRKFIAETGFDPRRDVSEIVISSMGGPGTGKGLIIARGLFNPARIQGFAQVAGGNVADYRGFSILSASHRSAPAPESVHSNGAITFLDSSTALMGDLQSVKDGIDRYKSNAESSPELLAKVGPVSRQNDFWFLTLVPISEFAGKMPGEQLQGAMKGNVLSAILQASGGIKFGDNVRISGEAVAKTEKDASALQDVFKFLAGMIQLNREKDPTAAQVASLLDTLELSTHGNIMTLSLSIPENQLERMIESSKQHAQPKRAQVR